MIEGMIIGAAIFVAGIITDRIIPVRRRHKIKKVKPICGCEHDISYHDPNTMRCHGRKYEGNGIYNPCTCRQYSGPKPIDEFFAHEIGS